MKAQEYLDNLIEECKVFSDKSVEYKDIYAKLFPGIKDEKDVKTKILSMDDEELLNYYKSSQVMLDVQTIFTKVASFIYFCKHIDIELDLNKVNEIGPLANYISNYIPFNTEFITNSDGELKEKKSKEFDKKFGEFKNSIGKVINIV